jgi:hypothetical protein
LAAVGGFTNSTSSSPHKYIISFIGQDQAGVYVGSTGCTAFPVMAASIQGFLNESKCFIATAAFGSIDVAPVELLRNFRDQILVNSSLGRKVVNWYYQWSPAAAEWLMLHPLLRLPILLLLTPLEGIVWLLLHPFWFLIFALSLGVFLISLGGYKMVKKGNQ